MIQFGRHLRDALTHTLLKSVGERPSVPIAAARRKSLGQGGSKDDPEKPRALARQSHGVAVALIVGPCHILRHKCADVFDRQTSEFAVSGERREQIAFAPRVGSNHHPASFLRRNRADADKLFKDGKGMVHHRRERRRAVMIERRKSDDKPSARAHFRCAQREKRLPVQLGLTIELECEFGHCTGE